MIRTFLGAVAFLTILPASREPVPPGRSAIFFPLVGAMLGAAGAGLYLAAAQVLPVSLAALLTVVFWTRINRMGTYGVVAVILSVIARWQALAHIPTPHALEICIAAQALPRAAMVALAWVSRPVGTGLGLELCSTLTTTAALVAIGQGVVAALACGLRPGVTMLACTYLIVRLARWYFYRRIGGVNGDSLGATEQLLETFVLLLFLVKTYEFDGGLTR